MVRSNETPGSGVSGSRPAQSPGRCLRLVLLGTGLNAAAALSLLSGCGGDGLMPGKEVAQDSLYWALQLNHHAVALSLQAPSDTLPLVATPRTADDSVLDGLPAPTYVSGDPEKVAVGNDGVLRALAPTLPGEVVPVVATLTAGNLKHADTVQVVVLDLDPQPVLASLSIHPIPNIPGYADSAKVGSNFTFAGHSISESPTATCFVLPTWTQTPAGCRILLPVRVLDATGDTIPGVPVGFRSSDEEAAVVNRGDGRIAIVRRPPAGQVTFYASTTVFGVTKVDTLPFRIGWPVAASINASRTGFDFPAVKVGVGAIVTWLSDESLTIDINFADPTNVASVGQPRPSFFTPFDLLRCQFLVPLCDEANNIVMIPNSLPGQVQLQAKRRFPVPGIYDYSSTALGGINGRIIVMDEP